jgi:hypothetical protein
MNKKNKDKKKDKKNELIIIQFLQSFFPYNLQKIIGNYYIYFHLLVILTGLTIILFCNKISYLFIVLLIICLDGIANIIFQDCPLTLLERKYCDMSMSNFKNIIYKKLGINYKCNHVYENQLEIVINSGCAVVLKIFILILCDIFNIKLSTT